MTKTDVLPGDIPRQRPMDEIIQTQKPHPGVDRSFSTSFLDRPSSNDQDPSAMTIEFLRARLQSERSVSRAARERAEQLAQKVFELEQRLESEIQLRKKLESARLEALSKYRGELNTEYGNFFDSNLEEGDSDRTTGGPKEDSHAGVASSSRSDDIERWERDRAVGEGFLQPIALEHDEGSRMGNFDRVDSAGHFNFEEDGNEGSMNDEEEIEQKLAKDKGILAWGRRGGRRQQSMERYARSFSRISSESTDAESPSKRWTGKSVRQKRRTENRVQDTNSEEGNGQTQDHEDSEENTGHPEERKDLQCNMERETEVERVLERQAELIDRFEAEENEQKAWEERFREQFPSISNGVEIQLQNKEESSISNLTDGENSKDETMLEEGAAHFTEADGNLSSQHEGVAGVHFEKAHLHDRLSKETYLKDGVPPPPSQTTSEDLNILGSETKKPDLIATDEVSVTSDALQGDSISSLARDVVMSMEKGLQERQPETPEDAKSNKTGEVAWLLSTSQKQIDSSVTDIQGGEKDVRASSGRHEGVGKLDQHSKLSSSFKFNGFLASPNQNLNMLMENVPSSSDQLQDHATGLNAMMKKAIQDPSGGSIRTEASISDQPQVGNANGTSSDEVQTRAVSQEETPFDCRTPNALRESREQDKESKGSFWSAGASGQDSFQDLNLHISRAASNQHAVQRPMSVFSDKPNAPREVAAMQAEAVAEILEGKTQRARTQSPWEGRNGPTHRNLSHGYLDRNSSHGYSDSPGRDSLWEDVFRRRIGTQETTNQQEQAGRPRTLYGFSSHPDLHMEKPAQQYASANSNRAKFPPFAARRGAIPDDFVPCEYNVDQHSYQDTAFSSHRKSVDGGFDRVMEVLRALQVAKQHIQSSGEQESGLNTAYRRGNDGRDALHVDPGSYSPSPQYMRDAATAAPYLSTHVTESASSSSKQPSHALRRAEQKQYWVPNGAHNSSVHRHDARQPSW